MMRPVVTADTKRDITALLNQAAVQYQVDPIFLLAGCIAESDLYEQAVREEAWPDVSYGLTQVTVAWLELPPLFTPGFRGNPDTPDRRSAAQTWLCRAENILPYTAERYARLLAQYGDPVEAWCRWNNPGLPSDQNPNQGRYRESLQKAEAYRVLSTLTDLRGKLPVRPPQDADDRYLLRTKAIQGITFHYTAAPVGQSVEAIAAYQISPAAAAQTGSGRPFPGIAYTVVVPGDGQPCLCWDLNVAVWHSAFEDRNQTHVGVCYTGDRAPTDAQLTGLAKAVTYIEKQVGRRLDLEGHRDPGYPTQCPGPAWPGWKAEVRKRADARHNDGIPPQPRPRLQVRPEFWEFAQRFPDYGVPRTDAYPFPGGEIVWTTPTPRYPKGGALVYREYLKEVRPVFWP